MKTDAASTLGFIYRFVPGNPETTDPTLLLLHGTGGNENDLLEIGRTLHPRAALLSPRGKILEHGMPRFFRRLAEGVFDEEDLIHRTHELADFVAAAAESYAFDPAKVVAVGYSNGANVAASTLLLRPEALRGAVLLRAMVPLVPKTLPKLEDVDVFLAAGDHDPIIPRSNVEQLADMLKRAGAKVAFHRSPAGHQLTSLDISAAKEWLSNI